MTADHELVPWEGAQLPALASAAAAAAASVAIATVHVVAARKLARELGQGVTPINRALLAQAERMADLAEAIDTGQAAGEIATQGSSANPRRAGVCTLDDLGTTSQRVDDARKVARTLAEHGDSIRDLVETSPTELSIREWIRGTTQITTNSGQFECYTPAKYLDAARTVLGDIDLDPASSPVAQQTVNARTYYTEQDDGLAQPWAGRVWMNPPFHRDLAPKFISKLLDEFHAGNVTHAIVLINNGTETRWGQQLLSGAAAVCFPAGRINFLDATGQPRADSGALQGQMFVYLDAAGELDAFHAEFGRFGVVL